MEKLLNEMKSYSKSLNYQEKIKYYSWSCVIGAFLCDSLGSYYEFQRGNSTLYDEEKVFKEMTTTFKTSPGQITDDSEMAMCLGYALMDSSRNYNINRIAYNYGMWFLSQPFDIGKTTRNALKCVEETSELYPNKCNTSCIGNNKITIDKYCFFNNKDCSFFQNKMTRNASKSSSCSNGFLMRKTPLSIYCMEYVINSKLNDLKGNHINTELLKDFVNLNKEDTQLTHSCYKTSEGAIIYSLIITRLIYFNSYYDEKELSTTDKCKNVLEFIQEYCALKIKNEDKMLYLTNDDIIFFQDIICTCKYGKPCSFNLHKDDFYEKMGFFNHALCLGIHFLKEISDDRSLDFIGFMKKTINLGGDTDTNACIVGGIIGSLLGLKSMPDDILKIITIYNPYTDKNTKFPRPVIFSPGLSILFVNDAYTRREIRLKNNKKETNDKCYRPSSIATLISFLLDNGCCSNNINNYGML